MDFNKYSNNMNINYLKQLILHNNAILSIFNKYLGKNKFRIGKNTFICTGNSLFKHTMINLYGVNNLIEIVGCDLNRFVNCRIDIFGNNNRIKIGGGNLLTGLNIWIEDEGGLISIGNNNKICGSTKISSIEGAKVEVGDNCLFSTNVDFKVGDSHSILSLDTNKRINPSQSIKIKDHVWFGHNTTILKGVTIENDTIIGTGCIVTKSPQKSNVILVGNPARIIKENVTWEIDRIKDFE